MKKTWYAAIRDNEDLDWGTGSYSKDEAVEMVKKYYPEEGEIAVIEETLNESGEVIETLCIEVISHDDIFED